MEQKEIKVEFGYDKQGRLFTRIRNGCTWGDTIQLGKVYFPDREFKDATPGNATVHIAKEFENFGFLKGHMDTMSDKCPTLKELLDWGFKYWEPGDILYKVESPVRGTYFVLKTGYGYVHLYKDYSGDIEYDYGNKAGVQYDIENGYATMESTLGDLWLTDAFGDKVHEAREVLNQLRDSWTTAMEKLRYRMERIQGAEGFSDLVLDGIDCDILSAYELPGYNIVCLSAFGFTTTRDIVKFSLEELEQMRDEVAKVNAEAMEKIKQAGRKGRLRLE